MKQITFLSKLAMVLTSAILFYSASFAHHPPALTAKPAPATVEESLALLPTSDALVVVDVARVMNDLMPQIRALSPNIEKDINEFINKTGIDPYRIKSAVIGVNMSGKNNGVAAIISGLTFDPARISTALREQKGKVEELKTLDYKGKSLYIITSKEAGKVGIDEEMAFTQMDSDRVALGNLTSVKAMLDGGSGNTNTELGTMLSKTGNGMIRFAANIPASAVSGLAEQGDMFKQFSTIKSIFGSLDMAADLSATLDAKMRTPSTAEATKLQTSLAGLVGLGKMFLGGNNDPQMQMINEILDLIRIGTQDTDVSLSVTVPRRMFDVLAEKNKARNAAKEK